MDEEALVGMIERLRTLGQEWDTVDAKRELILREAGDKAEFVKDVVAMANNAAPSYLLIGLEDSSFADVGALSQHYTQNDINQVLADKVDPPVVVNYEEFNLQGNQYALIEIMGRNPPYLIARDLVADRANRKQTRVYKGTIFVRHQDRTEGIGRSELEELLKRRWLYQQFERESERVQSIVRDRPYGWEYLLTAEMLKPKLAQVAREMTDIQRGVAFAPSKRMGGRESIVWIQTKIDDLLAVLRSLGALINHDITESWGPPGQAGDPLEIKRAVDKVVDNCHKMLGWEMDLRSVTPPAPFARLRQLMEGWANDIFKSLESIPDQILAPFQQPKPTGQFNVHVTFRGPSNLNEAIAELARLKAHPREWIRTS